MSASESVTSSLYAETLSVANQALHAASHRVVRSGLVALEVAADFLTAACGLMATFWFDAMWEVARLQLPLRERAAFSVAAGLLVVLLLERDGAYRGGGSLLQIRETERALRISFQSLLFLLPLYFVFGPHLCAPLLLGLLILPLPLMLQKRVFLLLLQRESAVNRVVIYGAGHTARRVVSALRHSLRVGLRPVAVIDDEPVAQNRRIFELGYRPAHYIPAWPGPVEPALLKACRCDVLVVVTSNQSPERLAAAEKAAGQAGARIAFLSGAEFERRLWTESIDLDGLSITVPSSPSVSWLYSFVKRGLDVILSGLLLSAFAPLFLLISLLIMLDSPGPALFVQRRVGRNGDLFNMYKFRSMYTHAPSYEHSPKSSLDPRITRVGRLLRRTSLDELPQLLNAFLGNMSLVGPRPEMPFIAQAYTAEQWQRLQVMPGITGLWQLSADRAFPIHESLQYDLYYIRNRGLFMDISILIHTLFFAMGGGV